MSLFAPQKVDEIYRKADQKRVQQCERELVPAAQKIVARSFSDSALVGAVSDMFGWAALGGAEFLRGLPVEIHTSFGVPETTAYTLVDAVLREHKALFEQFIPNIDAIRRPWESKVEKRGEQGARSSGAIAPVSVASEPEVVAFEQKGLRHQDAEDRLAIRVRMIEQLAGIKFNNQNLEERFRHAIRPALKGVKELDAVRRDLSMTEDKGGVGMGNDQVEEVIGLIERLEAKDRELAARATIAKPEPPKSMLPMVEEPMVPAVAPRDSSAKPQNDNSKKLDQLIRQSAAEQPLTFGERNMHDVVARPISMGPIEELRTMDLTDFRRLATKAGAAADKIRQKLAVLREDGIDRYAAGIKAWQESSVYGAYTQMIREGLTEGRSVEDLAAADTNDPERLSSEELQAVIELNKSLRF